MTKVARVSIDGEKELFEDLLNRILNDHKDDYISWI